MNREAETREQIVTGLNRSCEGIESVISSVDLGNVDLGQLKNELIRRIGALQARLEEYAEDLAFHYTQYLALKIEGFALLVDRIDELANSMARFGNAQGSMVQEAGEDDLEAQAAAVSATAEPVDESVEQPADADLMEPVVDEEPEVDDKIALAPPPGGAAPPAVEPPPVAAPPSVEAEPSDVPVAETPLGGDEEDPNATMMFDVPPAADDESLAPDMASAPTMEMPFAGAEQTAAEPEPAPAAASPGIEDDDLMYAQTMQFSMQDIEAAKNAAPSDAAPAAPIIEDAGAEPIVVSSDDAPAPPPTAEEPPPAKQAPPQAPPVPPAAAQGEQKKDAQGNLISGDDLMEQMDSFFNFSE